MNPTGDLDFAKIFLGFYRHKGLVFAVTIVVFLLAAYVATTMPNVYRSSTLILITPQRVPANFVAPTVTMGVAERINAISQEILSRTRLESIIKEFGLFPGGGSGTTMEDRVNMFRGNIRLDVRRTDAFQISYDSGNPETAMKVANRLASLFIEQNLQVREQQAIGTTNFLNSEAERLRKELEEQEALVTHYKIDNRFELPDQLDANLRMVEQLRDEYKGNMATLASMQERLGSLQKQLVEADAPPAPTTKTGESDLKNLPANQKIKIRQNELESLLVRYSEKHPDVMRLRSEIATIQKELEQEREKAKKSGVNKPAPENPLKQIIEEQIDSLKSSINAIQASNAELRDSIAVHQKRVENTPLRSIELTKVTRTYDITLRKYQDLLAKGLESQLSENLEKKQKGEQFQVIDPANLPLSPIKPNRPFILFGGLIAGIIGGLAAAFLWDLLDRSFKNSDDLAGFVDLPILATIPAILTRGAVLERRRAQGLLGISTLGVLLVGLILVRMFGARFF